MNSRPFVQTCFDTMHAPRKPHASVTGCALFVCSVLFSLEMSLFPSIMYHWCYLFMCRVFCKFSFLMVFSFLNGLDFEFGLSCNNLINKSTSQLNVRMYCHDI